MKCNFTVYIECFVFADLSLDGYNKLTDKPLAIGMFNPTHRLEPFAFLS